MTLCDVRQPDASNLCIKPVHQKRAETISFRPFFSSSADRRNGAPFRWRASASALPRRLGFVDRFLMIPAATADGLVHRHRRLVAGGVCFAVTATAESRAAPGRKLIDLCGPVIQTGVHCNSPLSRNAWLHGAPDSFSCGYQPRYRPCPSQCNVMKTNSYSVQSVGKSRFAHGEAARA